MSRLLGVDVHSGYDTVRPIDWHAAKAADVHFAIAKCSVGNEPRRDDRSYRRNVDGARAAGVIVGAYHFAFPLPVVPGAEGGRSPRDQADRAWRVSGELGCEQGELPPALDLEWPPHWERAKKGDPKSDIIDRWAEWGITAASIADWGLEYLERMHALSGRRPLLYTYPDFWKSLGRHGQAVEFADYPLWIATYPDSCLAAWVPGTEAPKVPAPWKEWQIWQFSADGSPMRIPGISACPIDRNVFAGSREDLLRLAGVDPDPSVPVSAAGSDFDIVHSLNFGDDDPPSAA